MSLGKGKRRYHVPDFSGQDAVIVRGDSEITARDEVRAASSCSRVNMVVGFYFPSGESVVEELFIPINDPAGLGLGLRSNNGVVRVPDPLPKRAVHDLRHFVEAVFNGRQELPEQLPRRTNRILRKFLDAIIDDLVFIPDPLPKRAVEALNDFLDDILSG